LALLSFLKRFRSRKIIKSSIQLFWVLEIAVIEFTKKTARGSYPFKKAYNNKQTREGIFLFPNQIRKCLSYYKIKKIIRIAPFIKIILFFDIYTRMKRITQKPW
jgi:hypothetical protein